MNKRPNKKGVRANKKRVRVSCHEPIAVAPEYKQAWSDAYISFKSRPGRTVRHYGPTLCSRTDLERSLEIERSLIRANPKYVQDYKIRLETALRGIDEGGVYIERTDDEGLPTLYTSAEWIDRAEAERMLRVLMASLGYSSVRFQWQKPDFVIHPS